MATLGNGLDYILKPTYSTTALWTVSAGNAYANQVITLDAGSYDFVIQNNFNYENITRQFNFTITDLKQALDLPLDQNISKTVNQSAEATVWKLTKEWLVKTGWLISEILVNLNMLFGIYMIRTGIKSLLIINIIIMIMQ